MCKIDSFKQSMWFNTEDTNYKSFLSTRNKRSAGFPTAFRYLHSWLFFLVTSHPQELLYTVSHKHTPQRGWGGWRCKIRAVTQDCELDRSYLPHLGWQREIKSTRHLTSKQEVGNVDNSRREVKQLFFFSSESMAKFQNFVKTKRNKTSNNHNRHRMRRCSPWRKRIFSLWSFFWAS